jgi:hypothetical protein
MGSYKDFVNYRLPLIPMRYNIEHSNFELQKTFKSKLTFKLNHFFLLYKQKFCNMNTPMLK